jgi:peptidoglycan-associated lipoprotein
MRNGLKIIAIMTLLLLLGGCRGAKLSTANEQLERGEYYDASKTYKKIYNKLTKREDRPLRGEVAYKMATCYRKLNMSERAAAAYQNAVRYEYPDSSVYLYLGRELQGSGKYQPAIEAYSKYLEYKPDDDFAKEGIDGCNMAILAKEKPKSRYIVKNAKLFNSRRADFAPMYLDKREIYGH